MGLDTSYDCWHGPYSSFHRFRVEVAKAAGIPLDDMSGFKRDNTPGISWEILKPDIIHILLNHSDCDDTIEWEDTKPLADRMTELLPLVDEYWRPKVQQFIDGLLLAHNAHDSVDFA